MYANVDAASRRKDNEALTWAAECASIEIISDEQLMLDDDVTSASCKYMKFARLNKKWGIQLVKVALSHATNAPLLGTSILQRSEAAIKQGRTLGGREIQRVVIRYYKPHDMTVEFYRYTDVQVLTVQNGDREAFQLQWNKWLAGLKEKPADEFLEPWYYNAVKGHKGIAHDISVYERCPEGSGGDRSYTFLRLAVYRYCERKRQQRCTDELTKALGAGGKIAAPAPKGPKTHE